MEPWMWPVVGVGLYLLHVWMWPVRRCYVCRGDGRLKAPLARTVFRQCDGCGGTGVRARWSRLRFGRRMRGWDDT